MTPEDNDKQSSGVPDGVHKRSFISNGGETKELQNDGTLETNANGETNFSAKWEREQEAWIRKAKLNELAVKRAKRRHWLVMLFAFSISFMLTCAAVIVQTHLDGSKWTRGRYIERLRMSYKQKTATPEKPGMAWEQLIKTADEDHVSLQGELSHNTSGKEEGLSALNSKESISVLQAVGESSRSKYKIAGSPGREKNLKKLASNNVRDVLPEGPRVAAKYKKTAPPRHLPQVNNTILELKAAKSKPLDLSIKTGQLTSSKTLDVWFVHLKEHQDMRAGDTLCLDYRVQGIQKLSSTALKSLSFAVRVNGTAWDEAKTKITEVFASGKISRQFTIDLPLGTHQLWIEFWKGGQATGIKSKTYNVSMRRYDEGDDTHDWDQPLDECEVSLLCRTLREFDTVMTMEQQRYFMTYYTLLGFHSWKWFTPWRGVHRYDKGVAGNHARMASHRTPWKNTIHLGIYMDDYSHATDLALSRTLRWSVLLQGNDKAGYTVVFKHNLFPVSVEIILFERVSGSKLNTASSSPFGRNSTWHSSNVEDAKGRLYHDSFELRPLKTPAGSIMVPYPTDRYLEQEFGLGWELLASNLMYRKPSGGDASVLEELARRSPLDEEAYPQCLGVSTEKAAPERRRMGWQAAPKMKGVWEVKTCFKTYRSGQPLPGEGVIFVSRKADCPAKDLSFMSEGDRDIAKQAHDLFGPDELVVEWEGPEIMSLQQEHVGNCAYRFRFNITLGGMHFLRVTLLRTNWSALREDDHVYQRPYFDDILGELKVFVFEGIAFQDSSNANALTAIHAVHSKDSRRCDASMGADAPGRWVMLPPASPIKQSWTSLGSLLDKPKVYCPVCEIRKPAFRACGSGKQWITDIKKYKWVPYDCSYPYLSLSQGRKCASGLRVLFSGDSHTRTFFNAFMEQVCSIPSAAQKGHATSQCHEPNATSPCHGGRMCLEHNFLGWVDATLNPEWWDVIVANFGQHPACGAHHWTQREYRRWLDQYMQLVVQRLKAQYDAAAEGGKEKKKGTQFIWYGTNAMPIARDKMMLGSDDWRTNPRLQMYEWYTKQRLKHVQRENKFLYEGQVLYVDAFSPTYPLQEAAEGDCGHFSVPSYQAPTVQQLLGLMCET